MMSGKHQREAGEGRRTEAADEVGIADRHRRLERDEQHPGADRRASVGTMGAASSRSVPWIK
jgi:hypothetical protein